MLHKPDISHVSNMLPDCSFPTTFLPLSSGTRLQISNQTFGASDAGDIVGTDISGHCGGQSNGGQRSGVAGKSPGIHK